MTTDTKFTALIERLEQASGPDRELDGSIWWDAFLTDEMRDHYDRTGYVRKCIARDGCAGKALAQFYSSSDPACLAKIAFERKFTDSLDSAMLLIPDNYGWDINHKYSVRKEPYTAFLLPPDRLDKGGKQDTRGDASTPAIALCLAALKARAALAKVQP